LLPLEYPSTLFKPSKRLAHPVHCSLFLQKCAGTSDSSETRKEESAVPQLKRPRLLASYSTKPITPTPGSSMQQLQKYLAMETTSIDDDCMRFWTQNSSTLDKLVAPALRALSVPASNAAVERVFSQGGIILRPHYYAYTEPV